MLTVFDTADGGVVSGVAVAAVDADGAKDVFACRLQNGCATKHYVGYNLGIRKVVGMGADEKELRQAEMLGEDNVGDLTDCEDRTRSGVVGFIKHIVLVGLGLGDGITERSLFEFFGEERNVVVEAKDGASE